MRPTFPRAAIRSCALGQDPAPPLEREGTIATHNRGLNLFVPIPAILGAVRVANLEQAVHSLRSP
jgi:hypothetical protein